MSDIAASSSPKTKPTGLPRLLNLAWRFISSFSLGIVILLLLTLLTLLGTLSQPSMGLYDTQKKYFDSYFFRDDIFGIPVILPGVYLLLGILFFNMLAGGLIRIRKKPQTIGVIIAHFAILFMIVAGWVSFHYKKEGNMIILPGETTDVVQAYHDWQIEIHEQGSSEVKIIRDALFKDCSLGKSRVFYKSGLPFQIKVSDYARNSDVVEDGNPKLSAGASVVEHFAVLPHPVDPNNEGNVAGLIAEVIDANSGQSLGRSILYGKLTGPGLPDTPPFVIEVAGKRYSLELRHERWRVPYSLRLEEAKTEYYEGTQKEKAYHSTVTKIDANGSEKHFIGMNSPLRHGGYTFFQSGLNPLRRGQETINYSIFAVVKNPSDAWPFWSCVTAACGLLLHFVLKLGGFLNRMKPKPTNPAV